MIGRSGESMEPPAAEVAADDHAMAGATLPSDEIAAGICEPCSLRTGICGRGNDDPVG